MKEFIGACADSMALCMIIHTVWTNRKHIAREMGFTWKGGQA